MATKDDDEAAGVFMLVWLLVVWPVGVIWQAFVVAKLWGWFVVPTFAVPPLTVAVAAGLIALKSLAFFNVKVGRGQDTRAGKVLTAIAPFLVPLMALVVGAVAKAFL